MLTARRVTRVWQGLCQSRRQPDPLIYLSQQHDAAITRDRATTELGLDPAPLTTWKIKN